MAFMTTAALGANLVAGVMGAQQSASAFTREGEFGAGAARYQAAVNANDILVRAENDARELESRAQSDRFNSILSQQLALSAEDVAGAEAHDYRRSMGSKLAASRAVGAAAGLALEGSPLAVDENAFAQIEFGVSRIVYGGQLQASRLRNQSVVLDAEANRLNRSAERTREAGRKSAENTLGAGEYAANASILSGSSKASSARSSGFTSSLSTLAKIGTTISTRPVLWS